MSVINLESKVKATGGKGLGGGGSKNIMQKTIAACRESILGDVLNMVKPIVETEILKNNATLNVEQLLKQPENKIAIIKENLKDL